MRFFFSITVMVKIRWSWSQPDVGQTQNRFYCPYLHVTCYCTFLCHISPPWTLQRTLLRHKGCLDQRYFLCTNEGVYHGNPIVYVSFTAWGPRGFSQWPCELKQLHRRPAPPALWVAAASQTSYRYWYLCLRQNTWIHLPRARVRILSHGA